MRRKRCINCKKLSHFWHSINGSPYHCYDGCFSTTGKDHRTPDGQPLWEKSKEERDQILDERDRQVQ